MTTMPSIDVTAKLSNNMSQLLHMLEQDFTHRVMQKCHQRGHNKIRQSHTVLFSHLGYSAQRLTTLAERAGITQQAMGKLVKELEKEGYLQRHVDQHDKRAKIIEPTDIGKQLVSDSMDIMDEVMQEYSELLGEAGLNQLEETLSVSVKALQIDQPKRRF